MSAHNDFYSRLMQYPWLVLGFLFGLAVLFAFGIPRVQLDASGDSLVLEGDRSLEVYRRVYKEYGATDFLFATYRPKGDLYSKETMDNVAALKDSLKKIEGVSSVLTYLDVPLLYSPKVTLATFSEGVHYLNDGEVDLALARQEFLESPVYSKLITSQSQKTTAIQINLQPDENLINLRNQRNDLLATKNKTAEQKSQLKAAEQAYDEARFARTQFEQKLVREVRLELDKYRKDAQIFLGGLPMILTDMLDFVRSDMVVFGSLIIVLMILSLALLFRAVRWVALPLTTCLLTCIYMLGGIGWVGIKLTVISANFIALLLIITLSITIHLVVRFVEYEKAEPSLTQFELVVKTMRFMIKPCTYTTMTTMVAFLSLILSDIRPVIDFGWMMTVAVGVALTVGFFLLPAGLMLLPRRYHEQEDTVTWSFTHLFAEFTEKQGKVLAFLYISVVIFSATGIAQLKVENRFIDYFDESTEIYQGMLEIDAELGGTLPLDIIINHENKTFEAVIPDSKQGDKVSGAKLDQEFDEMFGDAEEDDFASDNATPYQLSYWFSRAGMQEIKKLHDYLDQMPVTGKVLSLATLYDVVNDVAGGNVDDIQLAIIKENLSEDIDKALIRPYLSANGTQTRISVRVKETDRRLNRDQMLKEVHHFMTDEMGYKEQQFEVTGMIVLYNNMLQSLFSSQITTLGTVFCAIMLMFAFLFRSLTISLLAIMPNVLAALFVLGGMGWFGIPLDMMTITIAAITVGIGVDDTIHYIHRFKKEFAKDGDYVASMYRSHGSIGLAMCYTSVTVIVGFSILALSNFTPSIYFGLLTSVAMFAALMGALLLLPQLLIKVKPLGK